VNGARQAKKWAMVAVKLLIVALVGWFVWGTISNGIDELRKHPPRIHAGWLVLSGILYLVGTLPAALFWRRVLHTLGQEAGLGETLRAYYIGHLGKYVPGKAMVVILRTGLIRSHRVDTGAAAASVFFETLLMMSVGAFWSAAILAVRYHEQILLCVVSLGLMVASGAPVLPPVFRRLARLAGVGRSDPLVVAKLANLGWWSLVDGFLAMTACWALLGVSLWAVLRGIDAPGITLVSQFPLCVASVSLAIVAGFVSFIPGGAVVRELVLAELLGRSLDNAAAVAANAAVVAGNAAAVAGAILLRLVWLGAELGLSAILFFTARGRADEPGADRLE
jgi:glycosyltransferase 2 family protein